MRRKTKTQIYSIVQGKHNSRVAHSCTTLGIDLSRCVESLKTERFAVALFENAVFGGIA